MIDEADKILAPKYSSHSEDASQSVASEGLKLMEGTIVDVKSGSASYAVDTSQISFVLCGAFSNKADEIAKDGNIGNSSGCGPVYRIQDQYGIELRMTKRRRRELAENAFQGGLGIRGIENSIRELVDDAIFNDCNRQCLEI